MHEVTCYARADMDGDSTKSPRLGGRSPRATAAATILAAVCGGFGFGSCSRSADEPVVLGAIYNLSGDQAELDLPSSRGARLAADEANRAGGVLGRPVRLVLEDGESNAATVGRKTRDVLSRFPRTAAFLGLSDSDMLLAAAPVAAAAGRVFLTSGATSPRLPEAVPEYLFLACFGDNVQAAAGAEWAYGELGARTAVVLYDDRMTYTLLLHGYFEKSFTRLGGQVLLSADFRKLDPAAVGDLPPADLVYLAAGPDGATAWVTRLREAGIEAPILGGDGLDIPEEWGEHPEVEKVFFTTHSALGTGDADPRTTAFRDAYLAAYGGEEPDAFAALGYDAVRLLLRAVTDAGTDEPEPVRRALAAVSDFEGVTGSLAYPAGERIPRKAVSVLEVANGSIRLARRLVPAEVPKP